MIEKIVLKSLRKIYRLTHKGAVYNHITVGDGKTSEEIEKLLMGDEPCMVCRYGSTEFAAMQAGFLHNEYLWKRINAYISGYTDSCKCSNQILIDAVNTLCFFSGFFPNEVDMLDRFYNLMVEATKSVDILGVWLKEDMFKDYFNVKINFCRMDSLEPYDYPQPWSKALEGKRVLVIHPFAKTIESQYKKRELLWENKDVLPEFELKTLKAVQTLAGEKSEFETWFDALEYMENQIDAIDFDIAIIGCGAYGFPLAAYCKKIGKKAVHLGGATQILFGIKGRRWDENPAVSKFYNEHWVRPLPEETPQQNKKVEGGCYW